MPLAGIIALRVLPVSWSVSRRVHPPRLKHQEGRRLLDTAAPTRHGRAKQQAMPAKQKSDVRLDTAATPLEQSPLKRLQSIDSGVVSKRLAACVSDAAGAIYGCGGSRTTESLTSVVAWARTGSTIAGRESARDIRPCPAT